MPTKLYFRDSGRDTVNTQSGTYPTAEQSAATSSYSVTGSGTLRSMTRAIGTGNTTVTTPSLSGSQSGFIRFFCSRSLSGAQTVGGGTITVSIGHFESNNNANFGAVGLNVYVWRPSTGTKVGTLVDSVTAGVPATPNGDGTAEAIASGGGRSCTYTANTSSVSASNGDVIIFEVWGESSPSMTGYTANFLYDGVTEGGDATAITSEWASSVTFAETFTFFGDAIPYTFVVTC
jgi:hypothetical protein